VLKALELDPDSGEAIGAMGSIQMFYDWDWESSEQSFRQAIDRSPGHTLSYMHLAVCLVLRGRFEESKAEAKRALTIDPLSVLVNTCMAGMLYHSREYSASKGQCVKALELNPDDIESHIILGLNYEQEGSLDSAIEEYEKARASSGNSPLVTALLGAACAKAGKKDRVIEIVGELTEMATRTYITPISWVMLYMGIGDYDKAFEWLEKASEERDPLLCYLGVAPFYDPLRSDRRLDEMLLKIGLKTEGSRIDTYYLPPLNDEA